MTSTSFIRGSELPVGAAGGRLVGDPTSALIHELKQGKHDLAVVGTHGRTRLSHVLLGVVAEKLSRLACW